MKNTLFIFLLLLLSCATANIPREETVTIYHAGMHTTISKKVADDLGLTDGCTIYTEALFKVAIKADEDAKH